MNMLDSRVPFDHMSVESFDGLQCRYQAAAGLPFKRKRNSAVVFDVKLDEEHVYVMVDEDLVKSHLLLAVREEVDVLKANITKLVDRIGSLERENAVLRGSVSADVLAQLEVPSTASSATAASSSSSVTPTGPLSRV